MGKREKREQRQAARAQEAEAEAAQRAEQRERFQAWIREQRCPACGGAVTRLLYGLFDINAELTADVAAGLIALRGCVRGEDAPDWLCRGCGHTWGRLMASRNSDLA
jgi:hypothetical protein